MALITFNRKWLFGGVLFLSSCTISMPHYQQVENLLPSPDLESSVEESLDTPFFCIGDWPEQKWWEIFRSEQLNDLIEKALVQNPTIQEAQARVEEAFQTALIERAELFPWVSFREINDWQHLSKNGLYRAFNPHLPLNGNLIDTDFLLDYDFDIWGQNRQLFRAAIGRERAAQADREQAKIVITTALTQGYFALKTNVIKRELLQELYELYNGIFLLQNLLKEKALLSRLPELLTEEKVFEAQKQLLDIDKEIATNKHLINILAGFGPDTCLDVDAALLPLPECISLPCDLSLDLLARRPDLMAQIWRAEALSHEVGAAIADFYPDVSIRAFAGFESFHYSKLLRASSFTMGAKPAIHLPIFTAGAIAANVKNKKAQFDEAVFEYNRLILMSAQEVADLLALAKAIFYQKQDQDLILDSALARYELTDLRIENGLDSRFESYYIQEELIEKQLEDIDLIYLQYLATVQLIKALGGGYLSDIDVPLRAEERLCP